MDNIGTAESLISDAARGLSTSEKIARAGIGLTKNQDLNTAINFLARKGAGVLDEFIVSLPADLSTSDENDLPLNVLFNTL